jgi:hypothetical protein
VGLAEIGYIAYADKPGIVEITVDKHKYNPAWINPSTGEEIPLKDYKGTVFSQQTPAGSPDWILEFEREGHKESMLKSVRFESIDPPVQEIETDTQKVPFEMSDPPGDTLSSIAPAPFRIKVTRANRASRTMQYVGWGEVTPGEQGSRLLGIGPSGTFTVPRDLIKQPGSTLTVRLQAINANGKAYEIDKAFTLAP